MVLKGLARLLDADERPPKLIFEHFLLQEIQKKRSSLSVAKREMNYAQKWKSSVFPLFSIFGRNYYNSFCSLTNSLLTQ